jgi:hypothetical protein
VASVDPTEARYRPMLNEKETTANQWVGVLLLSVRGDRTPLELFVQRVAAWDDAIKRLVMAA